MLPSRVSALTWLAFVLGLSTGSDLDYKSKGFFTGVFNDGHSLCDGTATAAYPYMMCWGLRGKPKSYNDMWYTMEQLSGWPIMPRQPARRCQDIEIDCGASYICTVLLEYSGVGPMPSFGEDDDRAFAAQCISQQCPKEASISRSVIAGHGKCPHTHQFPSKTKRQGKESQSYPALGSMGSSTMSPSPSPSSETTSPSQVATTEVPSHRPTPIAFSPEDFLTPDLSPTTKAPEPEFVDLSPTTTTTPEVSRTTRLRVPATAAPSAVGQGATTSIRHEAEDEATSTPEAINVSLPPVPDRSRSTTPWLPTTSTPIDVLADSYRPKGRPLHGLDWAVGLFLLVIIGILLSEKYNWTGEMGRRPGQEMGNRAME